MIKGNFLKRGGLGAYMKVMTLEKLLKFQIINMSWIQAKIENILKLMI
jgi:hypothetical protein